MAETDRVFVDHTELNVLERLFYPPISAPSTKIGRNKMHSFGDLLPGIKCHSVNTLPALQLNRSHLLLLTYLDIHFREKSL